MQREMANPREQREDASNIYFENIMEETSLCSCHFPAVPNSHLSTPPFCAENNYNCLEAQRCSFVETAFYENVPLWQRLSSGTFSCGNLHLWRRFSCENVLHRENILRFEQFVLLTLFLGNVYLQKRSSFRNVCVWKSSFVVAFLH